MAKMKTEIPEISDCGERFSFGKPKNPRVCSSTFIDAKTSKGFDVSCSSVAKTRGSRTSTEPGSVSAAHARPDGITVPAQHLEVRI